MGGLNFLYIRAEFEVYYYFVVIIMVILHRALKSHDGEGRV